LDADREQRRARQRERAKLQSGGDEITDRIGGGGQPTDSGAEEVEGSDAQGGDESFLRPVHAVHGASADSHLGSHSAYRQCVDAVILD
jgi:hypothetical protein